MRRVNRARTFGVLPAFALALCACGKSGEPVAPGADDSGVIAGDGASDGAVEDDVGTIIGTEWFDEVGEASGLTFRHALDKTLIGRLQGGVCAFDADGDGALDLLFPSFVEDGASTTNLMMGRGLWKWVDETAARGLSDTGHALGCVAFDVDGDGDLDVLTVGLGVPKLFRNDRVGEGAGRFVDVSARLPAIFPADELLTAAVAFDADGDGDLDIAISSYGTHETPVNPCTVSCKLEPETYERGTTRLLLQSDDGTFEDATARLGTYAEPGLVLLATDLDGNGTVDLFLGNDVSTYVDRYFANDGKGTFVDTGKALGVATSGSLKGVCSMSASDGDIDGDGQLDLVESSYAGDIDALFNCKAGKCKDIAEDLELFRTPRNLRWGQAMVDFDDDGIPELVEAAGHLYVDADFPMGVNKPDGVNKVEASPLLWFRVDTTAPLQPQSSERGLAARTGGRGLVATDLDGDGAVDVVIGSGIGRPLLLKNIRGGRGHALNVRLVGKGKNTRAIGAKVTVKFAGKSAIAMAHAGGSYHSSVDGPLHFGLGTATVANVEVRWPSGKTSTASAVPADKPLTITEP